MNFGDIENVGKKYLERFPTAKRVAKRIYQIAGVVTDRNKIKSEGNITRVTPDDEYEYFYGYYDKSPWDATDRYLICLRANQTYKSVAPKEAATICLVDTRNDNQIIEICPTHSWNVQQGCMAQWLGPDFKSRIIFNDFRDNRYCSVVFNTVTMREEKVLPIPVYDVSRDGSFALSLDFSRLHRLRPGYGYSNLPDMTEGVLCPDLCCIWKLDIQTGKVEELFRYTEFAAFESKESMLDAEHKVNHLMICPNGKRFMVLHRWFYKGRKSSRLITVNTDKTEMYNLSDDVFVSHCYWKNDEEVLSFLRKKDLGNHYYLMRDKSQEYKMFWPELKSDGHCSYSPDGKFIITDTYPNRKRLASIYICKEEDIRGREIARVFSPFKYDNDCRCDLHPRWNRSGSKICFDSVHEGKRGLYETSVNNRDICKSNLKNIRVLMIDTSPMLYDGITSVIMNYISNIDRNRLVVDVLAINDIDESIKEAVEITGSRLFVLNYRNTHQIKYIKDLSRLIRKNRYDLIHVHGNSCTMAIEMIAGILGRVKIRCAHSHNTKCKHVVINKALKPLFSITYTNGFACGNEAGKWLFGKKEFSVLNNAIDTEKFRFDGEARHEIRKSLGVEGKKVIGCVAHFTPHKNHLFLINVFKDLLKINTDFVLVLVGDGELRTEIEKMVGDLNIKQNVIFTGIRRDIPRLLSAFDIMTLPSLYEGFPCVAIEWQCSGLFSILSNCITDECKMTDLVRFVHLDKSSWIKAILEAPIINNRIETSSCSIKQLKEKQFDIVMQGARLKDYYESFIDKY